MANNLIQVKRTSVSGRAANSTTLPNPGELALNMTDGILYSTNGSAVFEIGANNTNVKVSNTLTVKTVSANGSNGSAGEVLYSNGTVAYWNAVPAAAGVNTDAQFVWSNTHTFQNNITFSSNLFIGNSTVNTTVNSTAFSGTANNASYLNGNTATTLRDYSDTMAGTAYSNATTFASNATNLSSGTVTEPRLPFRMDQNVRTTDDVTFHSLILSGNLVVSGGVTSIVGNSVTFTDNMFYMNQGVEATITNVSGNGTYIVFTADNNFQAGWDVFVSGVDPTAYNGNYTDIFAANSTSFTVTGTTTTSYVSGGLARGKTDSNPDLGWTAGYNDGTYHHAGMFRDASDGIFKVFDNYRPEPDSSIYIDTSNSTFHIADFMANTLYLGNTTANWLISNTSGLYHTGTINAASITTTSISGNLTGNVSATTISGNLTGNVIATTISGNLTGNVAATTISGNLTGNVSATTISASANITVGNILLTTANLAIGNSTVNVYANTTAFVGNTVGVHTGNVVATTISGNLTGNVAATTISGNLTGNVAAITISGNLTGNVAATTISASANISLGANILLTTANLAIGNATANIYANSTAFVGNVVATSLSGNLTGNVIATTLSGNLTGNVVATSISGNLTGNVVATTISGNLTGNVVATTINASSINATSHIDVGANVYINTSVITIGNSTINTVANSTTFVGNVVAVSLSGNLTGNVVATTISGNLTGNVSATILSGNLTAITANVTNKLQIGAPSGYDFGAGAVVEADANVNTYAQFVLQNANTGNNASTDMVLTNDVGTDTAGYIDLGINGSNYNQPGFNISSAGDGYLYTSDGNLVVGTASDADIIFHAGGTTASDRVMSINSTAIAIEAVSLLANSVAGSAGQVLTSNGSGIFWSTASAGVNSSASYAWTNTHSFAANVTLAGVIANGSIGTNNQVLKSNGSIAYWSNNSLITLSDTPTSYSGSANYLLAVNGTGDGVGFTNNISIDELVHTARIAPATPSVDSVTVYLTASGVSPNREVAYKIKNELGEEVILSSILV